MWGLEFWKIFFLSDCPAVYSIFIRHYRTRLTQLNPVSYIVYLGILLNQARNSNSKALETVRHALRCRSLAQEADRKMLVKSILKVWSCHSLAAACLPVRQVGRYPYSCLGGFRLSNMCFFGRVIFNAWWRINSLETVSTVFKNKCAVFWAMRCELPGTPMQGTPRRWRC